MGIGFARKHIHQPAHYAALFQRQRRYGNRQISAELYVPIMGALVCNKPEVALAALAASQLRPIRMVTAIVYYLLVMTTRRACDAERCHNAPTLGIPPTLILQHRRPVIPPRMVALGS